MNIILFHPHQSVNDRVTIKTPRVIEHVIDVLKASPGEELKIGRINGPMGTGTIEAISPAELVMTVTLDASPPSATNCILVLAMPRPKVFKRTLQAAITLGIKSIHVIKTWRVDKNYFESPALSSDNIEKQIMLGLEQAGDTLLPEVVIHRFFKPFIEDVMPQLCQNKNLYIAHPCAGVTAPERVKEPSVLAIGPEGGFIPYELERFNEAGFVPISMGRRILRVEQAVPAFLARMFI